MNRNGITGQFVVDIVSNLAEVFTTRREKMWGFLHEAQQTLDLKFGEKLKMKSTSWLNFTFLGVPAHNLYFARALAQKVTFPPDDWLETESDWLISARASFSLLHHKKNYLSCKENFTCFDGSYLMVRGLDILYTLKEERRKTGNQRG